MSATETYAEVSSDGVYRLVNERLAAFAPPPTKAVIADIGCGDGSLVEILLEHSDAIDLWGLDPDPDMLRAADARCGQKVKLVDGAAERADEVLAVGAFDVAYFANCIHMMEDVSAAFAAAFRLLKPDGLVGLNTTFFKGSEDPADRVAFTRLLVAAGQLAPRPAAADGPLMLHRPPAKRTLGEAFYREEMTKAGFTDIVVERRTVTLGWGLLRSIVGSEVFAGSVLKHLEPMQACGVLREAFDSTFLDRDMTMDRQWLFIRAYKPSVEAGIKRR